MIGVFLGGLLAYAFYGKRLTSAGWLPEQKVKQRLASTLIDARPVAQNKLDDLGLQLSDLRKNMSASSIDLEKSRRTDDSIYYHVETPIGEVNAELTIAVLRDFDRDSTATLWTIEVPE
jgi:hypothetical protein